MFSLISKIGTFIFDGSTKWIIIASAFILLLILYYNARLDVKDLEIEISHLNTELATANDSIVHLNATVLNLTQQINNKVGENNNIQSLLDKCYDDKTYYQQRMDEIEAIMHDKTPPVQEDTSEVETYVPVTEHQMQKGIDFVNRQYQLLSPTE